MPSLKKVGVGCPCRSRVRTFAFWGGGSLFLKLEGIGVMRFHEKNGMVHE